MTDHPQTDDEIAADDERRFDALRNKSEYAELPGIDRAMWRGDLRSDLDVSEFNDRYFTLPFPTQLAFILYLASGWQTVALFACVIEPLWTGASFDYIYVIGYIILSLPLYGLLVVTCKPLKIPAPIFNRQAQTIHVWIAGRVIHLPWRDMRPFTFISILGKNMEFWSKIPKSIRHSSDWRLAKKDMNSNIPFHFDNGNLDPLDKVSVSNNLQRLEFIRRYMEHGVSAVQPTPGVTLRRPEPTFMKQVRADGWGIYRIVIECFYWFGLGPLVDLWIKWMRSKAVWPEEVHRLCSEDADLSEFDTRPVHPDPDVFYRYDTKYGGYYLCNSDGEHIT